MLYRHFFQEGSKKTFIRKSKKRFVSYFKYTAAVFSFVILMLAGLPLTAENLAGYSDEGSGYTNGYTLDSNKQYNYAMKIPLSTASSIRLSYASDPQLELFNNAFGAFYELEGSPFTIESLDQLNTNGRLLVGLINMPNYAGVEYFDGRLRSDAEKTLVMMGTQFGIDYRQQFYLSQDFNFRFGFKNDSFVRLVYNLYDLAPSIYDWERGGSINEILSIRASGLSYSTLKNRFLAQIGVGNGLYYLDLSLVSSLMDFFYYDNAVILSFSREKQFNAAVAYEWASYDTLNGVTREKISANLSFEHSDGTFSLEGQYRADDTWSIGVSGTIYLDTDNTKKKDAMKTSENRLLTKGPSSLYPGKIEVSDPGKIREKFGSNILNVASKIEWDKTLLERNDLSMREIGAILEVNQISRRYDYDRVAGLDYRDIRTPEEFITDGGICRDAANTVANILLNNGYESKIVYSKQAKGTPHTFVVTQDSDGSYYLFNYEHMYEVPDADSLQETARSFSKFLNLYLLDPVTHEVTDIVITPDSDYLENIAGMR